MPTASAEEWITYAHAAKLRGCSEPMISLMASKNGWNKKRDPENPRRLLLMRKEIKSS